MSEDKMVVKYNDLNDNEIKLSPAIVQKYLCPNAEVTQQEMVMFLKLCQHQQLNPFLREVYLVKYGNNPATMVTGKETFLKRAKRDPNYAGHKVSTAGQVPDMTATAEVYVKGYEVPITCTVDYEEYVGIKRDGTPNGMWASKPKTMLKKVALVQALREAFPDTFGGMYSQEEISHVDADSLPTANVVVETTETAQDEPEAKDEAETVEAETLPPEGKEKAVEPKEDDIPMDFPEKDVKEETSPQGDEPAEAPSDTDPTADDGKEDEDAKARAEADADPANQYHSNMEGEATLLDDAKKQAILTEFAKLGRFPKEYLAEYLKKDYDKWDIDDRKKLLAYRKEIINRRS